MNEERESGTIGAASGVDVLSAASREKADAYLDEQIILTRLQAKEIAHELALRHWSIRFSNFSAVMKVLFELTVALIVIAIAAGIGAAVWSASNDTSLVIESFTVPPDMANRGLTGQAVAAQLQDRLSAMQDATDSARPADSFANNWGNSIKVQIPDTGISVSEFYRALTAALGRQTHITGEVWHTGNDLAIGLRAGANAARVSGAQTNFDALLQKAAEAIYARTQPYRFAIYAATVLNDGGLARSTMRQLTIDAATPRERAWAWVGMGAGAAARGDLYGAIADQRRALAIVPDFALAWVNVAEYETTLGHTEAALAAARESLSLLESGRNIDMAERAKKIGLPINRADVFLDEGDSAAALPLYEQAAALPDYASIVEQAGVLIAESLARLHETARAEQVLRNLPRPRTPTVRASRLMWTFGVLWHSGKWTGALKLEPDIEHAVAAAGPGAGIDGNSLQVRLERWIRPRAADAMAATGDFRGAAALIARTPFDCYLCVTMRGSVAGRENNRKAANVWFARAVAQAPSIPFAYADWGQMLLRKGDYDAAIAKFALAHVKGPHFADPVEMWGEALMQKNRSDLALAKFSEANRYAPHWGRLHLEWGKALMYVNRKNEAQQQFAIASHLDLSTFDAAALAKIRSSHV